MKEQIELLCLINQIANHPNSHLSSSNLATLSRLIDDKDIQVVIETTIEEFGKEKSINNINHVYNRLSAKATLKDWWENYHNGLATEINHNDQSENYLAWIRSYVTHTYTNQELKIIFQHHAGYYDRLKGEVGNCHVEAIVQYIIAGIKAYEDYCIDNEITEAAFKTSKEAVLC